VSEEREPTQADTPPDAAAPREGAGGAGDLAYEQARLAYSIIQSLLEHTRVTGDLVALMAQALGEETLEALTNTPHWAAYMDSRRALERTREDVERFAAEWTRMAGEGGPGG
jgi:formate dehydrogenase assembly factor FdhD